MLLICIQNIRGQSFDNTTNVSGKEGGMQAHFENLN